MTKILHITPHFGGGVGTVLTALLSSIAKNLNVQQEVISFEYANNLAKAWSKESGIKIVDEVAPDSEYLHTQAEAADIIHLHFWNHPALYQFLYLFSGKESRMLFWSHTNGLHAPYLFNRPILDYPEIFTVASEFSLNSPLLKLRSATWQKRHLRCVHSSAGTESFEIITKKNHKGFNILYVGTVDYCKLHPDFLDICERTTIADSHFIICGGDKHLELEKEAQRRGLSERITCTGKITQKEVREHLATADVFLYPLNQENYGTGEQVLIEAMSAGVPQVVLNNGPESYVIKDGVTGIVASSIGECISTLERLNKDKELRKNLSISSQIHAKENYSLALATRTWIEIYNELLTRKKKSGILFRQIAAEDTSTTIAWKLFLLGLGDCEASRLFQETLSYFPNPAPSQLIKKILQLPSIFLGDTRGSIRQYSHYFACKYLNYICQQISNEK